jgi:diguanylate cyclase (GGDEF)-like protein/PAS domain S-box-containing protein
MERLVKRVLVIGRDSARMRSLCQRLRRNRLAVSSVSSGTKLGSELAEMPFDAGIGIISTQDEDTAWQLIKSASETGLPLIALLARDLSQEAEQKARALGAGGFIREPFKIQDLEETLNSVSAQRSLHSRLQGIKNIFEAAGRINAELELKKLLPVVFTEITRLLSCRQVRIFLFDGSQRQIAYAYSSTFNQKGEMVAEPIEKRSILTERQAIGLTGSSSGQLSTTIHLPLVANSSEIGTLCLDYSRIIELSDFEIEVLNALAGQIGVAVANASRYEKEQRQSRQHFLISEMGRQVSSCASCMDVDSMFSDVVEIIRRYFNYDVIGIFLTEKKEKNYFSASIIDNQSKLSIQSPGAGIKLFDQIMKSGETVVISYKEPGESLSGAHPNTQSCMAVPIWMEGDIVGILNFESIRASEFTEDNLAMAEDIAMQVAVAVRNMRLYRQLQSSREYLETILDAAVDTAIISTDLEGRIVTFSLGASMMFAITANDVIGTHVAGLFLGSEAESAVLNLFSFQNQYLESDVRLTRKDGSPFIAHITVRPLAERWDTPAGYLLLLIDITERVNLQERLHRMSITDELTGLYNKRYFYTILAREVARARRSKDTFALCFFDLDRFKSYNDTQGHLAGDNLLKWIGEVVSNMIRRHIDLAFRNGGDEFVLILPGTPAAKAAVVGERIRAAVEAQFESSVTISFGITEHLLKLSPEEIVKRADNMMYEAKRSGGNRVCIDELVALQL